jgi:hypothetical protein
MDKSIIDLPQIIVLWRKPNVTLLIDPYCKRVPVSDKDPLPDVKLLPADEQRVLNVLLDDPLPGMNFPDMDHHFIIAPETLNTTAP